MQGQTKKLRINHLSFFCEIRSLKKRLNRDKDRGKFNDRSMKEVMK